MHPDSLDHPNYLHFVWFGEDLTTKIAPDDGSNPKEGQTAGANLERMIKWAKTNRKCYKVCLWTEEPSSSEVKKKLEELREKGEDIPEIVVENFKYFRYGGPGKEELNALVDYFIKPSSSSGKELPPNYAAASDIARCMILYQLGGIYIDMDTEPNKPIPPIDELLKDHSILLGAESTETNTFATAATASNDVIVAKKGDQVLEKYLTEYAKLTNEDDGLKESMVDLPDTSCPYEDTPRYYNTLALGPNLLRVSVIESLLKLNDKRLKRFSAKKISESIEKPEKPLTSNKEEVILPLEFNPKYAKLTQTLYFSAIFKLRITVPVFDSFKRGKANSWFKKEKPAMESSLDPETLKKQEEELQELEKKFKEPSESSSLSSFDGSLNEESKIMKEKRDDSDQDSNSFEGICWPDDEDISSPRETKTTQEAQTAPMQSPPKPISPSKEKDHLYEETEATTSFSSPTISSTDAEEKISTKKIPIILEEQVTLRQNPLETISLSQEMDHLPEKRETTTSFSSSFLSEAEQEEVKKNSAKGILEKSPDLQ